MVGGLDAPISLAHVVSSSFRHDGMYALVRETRPWPFSSRSAYLYLAFFGVVAGGVVSPHESSARSAVHVKVIQHVLSSPDFTLPVETVTETRETSSRAALLFHHPECSIFDLP